MDNISKNAFEQIKTKIDLKSRSIIWDITIKSVLVIVVVSIIVVWLSYINLSQKAMTVLEKKADEYILLLEDTLEIPLWNLDLEYLEGVCQSYISNDLIVNIRITDAFGEILVEEGEGTDKNLIKRNVEIFHNEELLANLDISLSPRSSIENNRQSLWLSILIVSVVFLFSSIFSGIILGRFIKKSFNNINKIVHSYADGKYSPPLQPVAYREFRNFITVLSKMGQKITIQMEELREAEGKYRGIFENAKVGIYQSTPEGRYISVNPVLAKILGYDSPMEVITSITDIENQLYVKPKQRRELVFLEEKDKTSDKVELELYHKDGSILWVFLYSRPVFDDAGKLLYTEGIVEDITLQKQIEVELSNYRDHLEELVKERSMELEIAKDEAETANKYKSEFLANMSHEIRTPMNAVLGFTNMLIKAEDDPWKKDKLTTIKDAGQNLLVIINDILDFTKIESGKLELDEVYFDFHRDFDSLIGLFTTKADIKNITFSASIDPALPAKVWGDLLRISQVLTNLLDNAFKFTPEKGSVILEIIRIAADASTFTVLFSVRDTGIGIAEEKKKLIFAAFTQADSSGTRKFGGTGLGLPISSNLVSLMGGELKVESNYGTDSRFFFGLEFGIREKIDKQFI